MKFASTRLTARHLLEFLFRGAARRRLHVLTALMLRFTTRRMDSGARERDEGLYNVLVIPKDVFLEDVASSLGTHSEFRTYSAPRSAFKAMASAYLPPVVDDNFYVSDDPKTQQCKEDYREFLSKMWDV